MKYMVKVLGKKTDPISVLIKDRIHTIFEGKASSVTSVNDQGQFDVLPLHSNFITLVKEYVIIDVGRETEKRFEIEKGLLSAILDEVSVYVGL